MDGLEVVEIKQASDEQIDLVIKNNVDRPFWINLGSSLIIGEAKNWTKNTPTEVFNTLRGKMDGHKNFSRLGFVIAMTGFSSEVEKNFIRDGANMSIWLEDGDLNIGSRTQLIYSQGNKLKPFGLSQDYIASHKGILKLLQDNPNYRLFGERLTKHTISYPQEYYNKFYLFDIMVDDKFLDILDVVELAKSYCIEYPETIGGYDRYSLEELENIAMSTVDFGVQGEGLVIKSKTFINDYGNSCYAKIVKPAFKEENSIVFGNISKESKESEFASRFITQARVIKIINKIEQNEDRDIRIEDTPKIIGMTYNDAFQEEMWDFSKKHTINFLELQRHCSNRSRFIFHKYLNDNESNNIKMTTS